jgi:Flp pilus assembly protein TadG
MMRTLLSRLRRDTRGASVIEFALFAPILAMMAMGISDFAMGYSAKLKVEGAVYRTLEKISVGSVQSDYQYLKAEAATAAGVPQSAVTVDNWLECNRVRQTDFTGVCADGQDTARYVSVAISTSYTPRFNYGPLVTTNGTVPISASSSLRIQ